MQSVEQIDSANDCQTKFRTKNLEDEIANAEESLKN